MNSVQNLRTLSRRDFAIMGVQDIAYIKPVDADNGTAYEVHAADGTPIAWYEVREVAFASVRQHDLEPVSVH